MYLPTKSFPIPGFVNPALRGRFLDAVPSERFHRIAVSHRSSVFRKCDKFSLSGGIHNLETYYVPITYIRRLDDLHAFAFRRWTVNAIVVLFSGSQAGGKYTDVGRNIISVDPHRADVRNQQFPKKKTGSKAKRAFQGQKEGFAQGGGVEK